MTSHRVTQLFPSGVILNILMPGLGHAFIGEFLFGIFVFLVMLIAVALLVVSYLVTLPKLAVWALLGLPIVFYLFSFVDLAKATRSRQSKTVRTRRALVIFLVVGVAYQALAPSAPMNFALRNLPEVFTQQDNKLSPLYHRGDLLKASRLAYFLNVIVVARPILHSLPERYDLVRFRKEGTTDIGMVVGLPGEQVEIANGALTVNGTPELSGLNTIKLSGSWPETSADSYSFLVATLNLGSVEHVYQVSFGELVGKVSTLF